MIIKTIKGMTFQLLSNTLRFFGRKSSDGFKIDQPSMNDGFVEAYNNMISDPIDPNNNIPNNVESSVSISTTVSTSGEDKQTDWRKLSLASKYNTLIISRSY